MSNYMNPMEFYYPTHGYRPIISFIEAMSNTIGRISMAACINLALLVRLKMNMSESEFEAHMETWRLENGY